MSWQPLEKFSFCYISHAEALLQKAATGRIVHIVNRLFLQVANCPGVETSPWQSGETKDA